MIRTGNSTQEAFKKMNTWKQSSYFCFLVQKSYVTRKTYFWHVICRLLLYTAIYIYIYMYVIHSIYVAYILLYIWLYIHTVDSDGSFLLGILFRWLKRNSNDSHKASADQNLSLHFSNSGLLAGLAGLLANVKQWILKGLNAETNKINQTKVVYWKMKKSLFTRFALLNRARPWPCWKTFAS